MFDKNKEMNNLRIGIGFDAHRFAESRDLVLGGVKIDYQYGLQGHSDADVLTHAIIDALLGAAGLGDIGMLFPDTDAAFRNIRSTMLLLEVYQKLCEHHYSIVNIDSVIICERPRIAPHVAEMKKELSCSLGGLDVSRIGIKGTTTEKLGFTGREEGIGAQAVALISLNIA